MHQRRFAFGLVVSCAGLATAVFGCHSASSADDADARAAADAQFQTDVRWVDEHLADCQTEVAATGKCTPPSTADLQTRRLVLTQSLADHAAGICDAARPLEGLEHPYFFVGVNVTAGVRAVGQAGYDVVFDLADRQVAVFSYEGGGVASLMGAELAGYEGYAFGVKPNVIEAWSGQFITASASVGSSLAHVAVGGSVFASPDYSVWGGAYGASVGLAIPGPPLNGSVVSANWTPSDIGTESLAANPFAFGASIQKTPTGEYLQFSSAASMALFMAALLPNDGVEPGVEAIGLAILQDKGWTIEHQCGDPEATTEKPPTPADAGTEGGSDGGDDAGLPCTVTGSTPDGQTESVACTWRLYPFPSTGSGPDNGLFAFALVSGNALGFATIKAPMSASFNVPASSDWAAELDPDASNADGWYAGCSHSSTAGLDGDSMTVTFTSTGKTAKDFHGYWDATMSCTMTLDNRDSTAHIVPGGQMHVTF